MKIYSTLTRTKEEFLPLKEGEVSMYVCGVTPYMDAHVGHAMSYITFDVIRRYLEYKGYRVKYIQNVTDIDDKIIDRALSQKIPARELADKFFNSFTEDMACLNIRPADAFPRATLEIPKMIEMITSLIQKGHAYAAKSGSVYFRVRSMPDYGKLSGRNLEDMMAGARIEPGDEKEHPMDFVMWKAAKPGEPSWPSPWGEGRPGWHMECSAMALGYLGESVDIHGGGQDLIFPHHENEIAQSECATGVKPFVRYWLHNGLLKLGEEKMSKSLGNLVTIKDALKFYSSDAIRLFVISSYYRNPLTYSLDALDASQKGAERLSKAAHIESNGQFPLELDLGSVEDSFVAAMDDDFDTPKAVATLFDLARQINTGRDSGLDISRAQQLLLKLGSVLGLTLAEPDTGSAEAGPFIELLLDIRKSLRQEKQFGLADEIRNRLASMGVVIEDKPEGASWHLKR
ncbi:MAG: cysteine--tRNA ligase [Dehalococcoidaceae bacterium]|nr:cysteine--tRNA ligase [Dehalococcoidaceae bacterium]